MSHSHTQPSNNPVSNNTSVAYKGSSLDVTHHTATINGIDLHYVTQGEGVPVILVHGIPHFWYTWHKQIPAIAAAGFKAVAIDVRGMGYSETPQRNTDYPGQVTQDLLGLLDVLGVEKAVFSGFDVGMNAIWDLAVLAPERVAGIIAFNTPILAPAGEPGDMASVMPDFEKMGSEHFYHVTWYNAEPEANVKLLNDNTDEFVRKVIWALSGDYRWVDMLAYPVGTSYLEALPETPPLPWGWFTQYDLDQYLDAYRQSGFLGVVNHYTSFGLRWSDLAEAQRAPLPANPKRKIEEPTCFICGDRDMDLIDIDLFGVLPLETMRQRVTDLREVLVVRGAGHLIHMEKPEQVNDCMVRFLDSLDN